MSRAVLIFLAVMCGTSGSLAYAQYQDSGTRTELNDSGCVRLFGYDFFDCGAGGITDDLDEVGEYLDRTKVQDAARRTDNRDNILGLSGSRPSVGIYDGIAGYIISIGYFINYVIIPLLFGVALLVFLYNIFRYFITESAVGKAEARTAAIYGVAAFVFLVSIWGIVNLFVYGLEFDREASLCPDWLDNWCGSQGFGTYYDGTYGGSGGGGFAGGSNNDSNGGQFGGAVGADSGDSDKNRHSPLAELLFGTFQDKVEFSYRSGPPAAQTNTVAIVNTASCVEGFNALQLAATVEPQEAAFALYQDGSGATRWQNLTDKHSPTGIGYDADVLNDLKTSGAQNLTIVHTHPRQATQDAGLDMTGHGPSAEDFYGLCDGTANDATLVTVDWNQLWSTTQPADACPRRSSQDDDLMVVDALTAVAMVAAGDRNAEWQKMLDSELTPSGIRQLLSDYADTDFDDLSASSILALTEPYEESVRIDMRQGTPAQVCAVFTQ